MTNSLATSAVSLHRRMHFAKPIANTHSTALPDRALQIQHHRPTEDKVRATRDCRYHLDTLGPF